MKKYVLAFLLTFIIIPSFRVDALSNDDKFKKVNCLYSNEDGYVGQMNLVLTNTEIPLTLKVNNLAVTKGSKQIWKIGNTTITNSHKQYKDVGFVLNDYAVSRLESADRGDSAVSICPSYLVYYGHKKKGIFNGTTEQIFVVNDNSQLSALNRAFNNEYEVKEEIVMKYKNGVIYGTDIDSKKLDRAESMESVQNEIEEIEKKLKTDPNNTVLNVSLVNKQNQLKGLYEQFQMLNSSNKGTIYENTEASNKADQIVSSVKDRTNLLNNKINISYDGGCDVISNDLANWLIQVLNIVKIGALVLTLVLGMLDFFKAVVSGEADAMKKVGKSFFKRIMAVVILFLVPILVEFILNIVHIGGVDANNPLCGIK